MGLANWHRSALIAAALATVAIAPALARDTVAEGSFDRTLKVSGAVDLTVETGSGGITVRTGDGSTIHVIGKIRVNSDWHIDDKNAQDKVHRLESNPPIEQNGNTITIGEIHDEDLKRNVSISYELVVPADTRLRSSTGSGSQELDGVKGPVEATTGSGSLRISHIGAELRASTGSGTITLDTIQGGVRANTGSGSIRADNVGGGITAQTGSGNIEYSTNSSGRCGCANRLRPNRIARSTRQAQRARRKRLNRRGRLAYRRVAAALRLRRRHFALASRCGIRTRRQHGFRRLDHFA